MIRFTFFVVQIRLLNVWLYGRVLKASGTSNASGVAGRPKALSYCLGFTLRTNLKPILKPISKCLVPD